MNKQVNFSVLIGATASVCIENKYKWDDLLEQVLTNIKNAEKETIKSYQEKGDRLWLELDLAGIRVSSEVTI